MNSSNQDNLPTDEDNTAACTCFAGAVFVVTSAITTEVTLAVFSCGGSLVVMGNLIFNALESANILVRMGLDSMSPNDPQATKWRKIIEDFTLLLHTRKNNHERSDLFHKIMTVIESCIVIMRPETLAFKALYEGLRVLQYTMASKNEKHENELRIQPKQHLHLPVAKIGYLSQYPGLLFASTEHMESLNEFPEFKDDVERPRYDLSAIKN